MAPGAGGSDPAVFDRLYVTNPGGFGSLVKYPALVLHYSGGLLLLLLRFCVIIIYCALN